mmetsp:Transcript_23826/g.76442  ORF Transcript_23826/g.76442 Transcript_23826/m.76442 type:complete len:208 (-) Transcript_23826:597-1220(-)
MTRRRASLLASCAPRSSLHTTATTRGGPSRGAATPTTTGCARPPSTRSTSARSQARGRDDGRAGRPAGGREAASRASSAARTWCCLRGSRPPSGARRSPTLGSPRQAGAAAHTSSLRASSAASGCPGTRMTCASGRRRCSATRASRGRGATASSTRPAAGPTSPQTARSGGPACGSCRTCAEAGTAPRSPTRPTASPCRATAGRRVC